MFNNLFMITKNDETGKTVYYSPEYGWSRNAGMAEWFNISEVNNMIANRADGKHLIPEAVNA